QIFLAQSLIRKNQHQMIEPGLVDCANRLLVGPLAQIEPKDFRADMPGQRPDVELALGQYVHERPWGMANSFAGRVPNGLAPAQLGPISGAGAHARRSNRPPFPPSSARSR